MFLKITSIVVFIIIVLLISLNNCSSFGKDPEGDHLKKISESSHYNKEREEFVNRRPDILKDMRSKTSFFKMTWEFMFGGGKHRSPEEKLPEVKPDIEGFLKESDAIKFIWFGHSTFIVNFEGKILLFDPVFSGSASPFSFMVKRFQDAVIKLEELPEVDYIIISHDHYDHLDMETIKFFKDKKTKFVTPLGVTSHIKDWGIEKERLFELDWWQNIQLGDTELILAPAQHFSGRRGFQGNKTLWGSWIVKGKDKSLYFSGDSGYDTHFKEIGDKYGPFDLTFIENGQYNEMWREVHVLPEETAKAFLDLKGKQLVPVHWGMFDLSLHNWYEPVEELEKFAKKENIDLLTPRFGEMVKTDEPNIFKRWWKEFIKND
ncbi:MAG: MBL fold metallo-hydrolase [Leptospiraceae bacterium]|nr:MBL fold metallo-hydrolase [Leptospiraceae bacterium]